jgi:hypothetical protein
MHSQAKTHYRGGVLAARRSQALRTRAAHAGGVATEAVKQIDALFG